MRPTLPQAQLEQQLGYRVWQDIPFHPKTCPDQFSLTLAHFTSEVTHWFLVISIQKALGAGGWGAGAGQEVGGGHGRSPLFQTSGTVRPWTPGPNCGHEFGSSDDRGARLPLSCRHLLSNSRGFRLLDTQDLRNESSLQHISGEPQQAANVLWSLPGAYEKGHTTLSGLCLPEGALSLLRQSGPSSDPPRCRPYRRRGVLVSFCTDQPAKATLEDRDCNYLPCVKCFTGRCFKMTCRGALKPFRSIKAFVQVTSI